MSLSIAIQRGKKAKVHGEKEGIEAGKILKDKALIGRKRYKHYCKST